ncbi:MAG: ParB N-terminal domain-containing protein, partial [Syntrophales bacterium]
MAAVTYEKGKLYDISIIDLKPDPTQPRKSMDLVALEELAASIKTHGIIQPILFRITADSPYLIIGVFPVRLREKFSSGGYAR